MSKHLIETLTAASTTLRNAMQAFDAAAIEDAVAGFCTALEAVKAQESWQDDADLRMKVTALMADLDSSQMFSRLLGDMTGVAQEAVAARNPDAPQPLYKPKR